MTNEEIRGIILQIEIETEELRRISRHKDYGDDYELDRQMEYHTLNLRDHAECLLNEVEGAG